MGQKTEDNPKTEFPSIVNLYEYNIHELYRRIFKRKFFGDKPESSAWTIVGNFLQEGERTVRRWASGELTKGPKLKSRPSIDNILIYMTVKQEEPPVLPSGKHIYNRALAMTLMDAGRIKKALDGSDHQHEITERDVELLLYFLNIRIMCKDESTFVERMNKDLAKQLISLPEKTSNTLEMLAYMKKLHKIWHPTWIIVRASLDKYSKGLPSPSSLEDLSGHA